LGCYPNSDRIDPNRMWNNMLWNSQECSLYLVGFCDESNMPFYSTKGGEFFYQLLKKDCSTGFVGCSK
jgi:hypothetical protein